MSQAVKAGLPTPSVSKPPTLPPIRYAAAVANSTHAAATTPLSAVSLSQQQPPSATASQPPTSVPPAQPSTASSNSNSNQSASGFAEANMGGTSSPSAISSPVASSIAPMTAPEESVGGDGSYFDGVDGSRQQSPVLSSVGVGGQCPPFFFLALYRTSCIHEHSIEAASVASPQPPYSTASVAASSPYIPVRTTLLPYILPLSTRLIILFCNFLSKIKSPRQNISPSLNHVFLCIASNSNPTPSRHSTSRAQYNSNLNNNSSRRHRYLKLNLQFSSLNLRCNSNPSLNHHLYRNKSNGSPLQIQQRRRRRAFRLRVQRRVRLVRRHYDRSHNRRRNSYEGNRRVNCLIR
jgi:hypothetical protein